MLSCWVPAPRLTGGQLMTYGRSVAKAMKYYLIDFETWPVLAANRATWREAINGGLLAKGRPRREAAAETNRLIDASIAALRPARQVAPPQPGGVPLNFTYNLPAVSFI